MLLSPVLSWLGLFILLISFIVIVTVLLKKGKVQNFGPWGLTALGLLFLVPVIFTYWLTNVYVVENSTTAQEFYLFGKPIFTFKNGNRLPITGNTHTIVVNNMDSLLQYETLHYGKLVIFGSDSTLPPVLDISPFTIASVSDDIDYLLMADAPSRIKVKNADKTTAKYWLHVKESNTTKHNEADEEITTAAIENATQIDFAKAFDNSMNGKIVKLEGYFYPPEFSYQLQGSVRLNFYERKNQSFASPQLSLLIDAGESNNAMQPLPKEYKPEEVKIKTNDGSYVYVGDPISVIGVLSAGTDYYRLTCKKLEKIPELQTNYATLNAVKLTADNITDPLLKGRLVAIEGELEPPKFIINSYATNLYIKVPGIIDPIKINILFGEGPGKLKHLPDNFSPSDVKIGDNKNRVVNISRKVLVYGVWDGQAVKAESINNM